MTVTVRDIAWAAGFIEGEGCFPTNSVGIIAAQVQREPLDRLKALFGGNIYLRSPSFPTQQPKHTWSIHGSNAASAIMTIWTFLTTRRKQQAEASLNLWKSQKARKASRGVEFPNKGNLTRHAWTGPKVSWDSKYCGRGHEFAVVGKGSHGCRQCARDYARGYNRAWRARKKESAANG